MVAIRPLCNVRQTVITPELIARRGGQLAERTVMRGVQAVGD
ncbi:hypothetical protein JCM19237_4799 [Photobacterium aphoticum]|uniref:Uncharacterized protein n=1 Tax=Photobacterium aphoticum TaxID=754436 RepID=A0A090QS34_9GAMM|nr:hypothetical protein JCM19237_4799 [Photobacterium aphoticum]